MLTFLASSYYNNYLKVLDQTAHKRKKKMVILTNKINNNNE